MIKRRTWPISYTSPLHIAEILLKTYNLQSYMPSIETRPTIVDLPTPRIAMRTEREIKKKDSRNVRMMLIGMQGEGGFSGHDPIGLGVIAKRVKTDHKEGVKIDQYDTQPELAKTGKIDTEALAKRMHDFATAPGDENKIVAVGLTIYSVNYWESSMIKYHQLCEEQPPTGKVDFVMGGAIPTHTDSTILKTLFPEFKIVKGEGEERISKMVGQSATNEELTESKMHEYADLQNYQGADRELTYSILHAGGMPKTEASRGCGFGNCSFCSREVVLGRGGRDFRVIPSETVIAEINTIKSLLTEFGGNKFEFADEDAFSDIGNTRLLVSALMTAQSDGELPRIPFGASLRVDSLLALEDEKSWDPNLKKELSLLDQLREVGMDKVFLGVEGGSNKFLHDVAKGQTTEKIMDGIATVNASIYTDPHTGEQKTLELEMGYITFAYKMDLEMLRENVQFLSMVESDPTFAESTDVSRIHARHVSSLFNNLEVRAGTNDAINIRRNIKKANDPTHRDYEKYQYLKDYDLDANFNVNSSVYENVPFLDHEVKRIYEQTTDFARDDASLYYAVKSAVRTDGIEDDSRAMIEGYFLQMKALHLQFLRNEVGLPDIGDHGTPLGKREEKSLEQIAEKRQEIFVSRRELISNMNEAIKKDKTKTLDSVRRELEIFINQENERRVAGIETGDIQEQHGALAVIRDEKGRVLIVRASGQDVWTFPGGNIHKEESYEEAIKRELCEEGGLQVEEISVGRELKTIHILNHVDQTTGRRPKLTLSHFDVSISGVFNPMNGDFEIADSLWLTPKELVNQRVSLAANVSSVAQDLIEENSELQRSTTISQGEIRFL